MQELRAQIQAQLKLADTLKKISEAAGRNTFSLQWLGSRKKVVIDLNKFGTFLEIM